MRIWRDTVNTFLDGHLANVVSSFKSYFPEVREKSEQLDWVTFTFSHLADAFIQSDLQLGNT